MRMSKLRLTTPLTGKFETFTKSRCSMYSVRITKGIRIGHGLELNRESKREMFNCFNSIKRTKK